VVQPIKVLYLVVDGSLPRAKMNQQLLPIRSAKEAEVTAPEIIARSKGGVLPDELKDKKRFDSNCITPGTDFTEIEFVLQKWWNSPKRIRFRREPCVIVSTMCWAKVSTRSILFGNRRNSREWWRIGSSVPGKPNHTHVLYGCRSYHVGSRYARTRIPVAAGAVRRSWSQRFKEVHNIPRTIRILN
jgi:hypothetical protein